MRAVAPRLLATAIVVVLAFLLAGVAKAAGIPSLAGVGSSGSSSGGTASDPFDDFLRDLADSTDEAFGATTAEFDTTGLDSLEWAGGLGPRRSRDDGKPRILPVSRFHRAEGSVLGARTVWNARGLGRIEAEGAYGFAMKAGRYDFAWRRTLWSDDRARRAPRGGGRAARVGSRVDLELAYGRETVPFAPEHAQPFSSTLGAVATGRDRQSFFERRGFTVELSFRIPGGRAYAGYRDARERAMSRETRFTLIGADALVPGVTPADPDRYREGFGGWIYEREDWDAGAAIEARIADARWRLRGVMAKGLRLGRWVKAHAQVEAGAASTDAPRQRRFELGGPMAVPSLGYGIGGGDHLLVGKLELVEGHDFLRALHLPHPDILVLQPSVFVQGGAVWDEAGRRNVVFASVPANAWKGSAGFALVYRPGLPDPETFWRFQTAWPVGRDSGVARFSLAIGRPFDLLPRP